MGPHLFALSLSLHLCLPLHSFRICEMFAKLVVEMNANAFDCCCYFNMIYILCDETLGSPNIQILIGIYCFIFHVFILLFVVVALSE